MGSGSSAPLPDLPYRDIMAVSFRNDAIVLFYAGMYTLLLSHCTDTLLVLYSDVFRKMFFFHFIKLCNLSN